MEVALVTSFARYLPPGCSKTLTEQVSKDVVPRSGKAPLAMNDSLCHEVGEYREERTQDSRVQELVCV
jgi:hypothetical protein